MATVAYYERVTQEDINTGSGLTTKRNPGGGTLTATQVNLSSLALGQLATTSTWTPGTVAAGSYVTTTVTVSGAVLGDHISVSFSISLALLQLTAYVSAANTVTVVLGNLTGAGVSLGEGDLSVLVFRVR